MTTQSNYLAVRPDWLASALEPALEPDLPIVDAHHHFEHHTVKADKNYTPRAAAKWQKAGKTCGAGLRIGVVDNLIDSKHPAFKGMKIPTV